MGHFIPSTRALSPSAAESPARRADVSGWHCLQHHIFQGSGNPRLGIASEPEKVRLPEEVRLPSAISLQEIVLEELLEAECLSENGVLSVTGALSKDYPASSMTTFLGNVLCCAASKAQTPVTSNALQEGTPPVSGTFAIAAGGEETALLSWGAGHSDLQRALRASLGLLGEGLSVNSISGDPTGGFNYSFTFGRYFPWLKFYLR